MAKAKPPTRRQVEAAAKAIARMVPCVDGSSTWNEPHGYDFPREYHAAEIKLIRSIARVAIKAATAV